MCGIAGFWAPESPTYDPASAIGSMTDALRNRGPDGSGEWWDETSFLAFGHRRLSILDLSVEGAQPMRSASGKFTITYNGEIFNYLDVRAELEPVSWRGHSDTEVMLAAFERWGIEGAVSRFNGQFAFAVWDRDNGSLTLVRDRLGIKPLYYGWFGGTFIFGSELDAIRLHPRFDAEIEPRAIVALLELGYVPAPLSVYRNVFKLDPGTILTLRGPGHEPSPRAYWSLESVIADVGPHEASIDEATDALDSLIRNAVEIRLISDVPVGAFLSGGVDSSLVCGAMQSVASGQVKTYSIGFEDTAFDEAPYAEKVANHLGTRHTNLYVSPETAIAMLPDIPRFYDEPFADASQIPTYLVSDLARREVTVSLSGDGGDELFGGYDRYARNLARWPGIAGLPVALRRLSDRASTLARIVEGGPALRRLAAWMPRSLNHRVSFGQWGRALQLVGSRDFEAYYHRSISLDATAFAGPRLAKVIQHRPVLDVHIPAGLSALDAMAFVDTRAYLPDDILVKVDRASMAVSLEARVPLLDYRIVEYCWGLDERLKIREGDRKWLLKHLLKRYVPPELTERPKQGFAVPIGNWIRGPLKEWARSLLDEQLLKDEDIFDAKAVNAIWRLHQEGQADIHVMLWRILMFQAWLDSSKNVRQPAAEKAAV